MVFYTEKVTIPCWVKLTAETGNTAGELLQSVEFKDLNLCNNKTISKYGL